MSFATFLADAEAVRQRGEWFVELYPKDANGVEVPIRVSRRGTTTKTSTITVGTDTLPANTRYSRRVLSAPTYNQSLWQQGKILSRSLPSFGSIKLNNRDGYLDDYRSYTWNECRFKTYFADYRDIANSIGKVADGLMAEPEWSLDSVTIPILGRESLFDIPISTRIYRGTGYMLELSGARNVSYGTPALAELAGSMCMEGWFYISTAPSGNVVPAWGWSLASTRYPFRLNLTTARNLSFRATVSGSVQGPTTTAVLSVDTQYHLAVVVSGTTVTFYIWNEDAQTLTTEVFTSAFTSSTRDTHVSGAYVHNSADTSGAGACVCWWDDCRLWNYARSLSDITANRYTEIGSITSALVHYITFNDGTGTTVTDSSANAAHGMISGAGTSTWLWSQEGGPDLAGTPKPDVWGEVFKMAPILVDPLNQGYQVAGGGTINEIFSYEGGLNHAASSAASYRAYLTTTPAAAQMLKYLPRGLFKLGSDPTLPISARVRGYSGGPLGYVLSGANITRDIITRRGPKLADPADIDTASFTSYNSAAPYVLGLAIYKQEKISSVLDLISLSGGGWWGYERASTQFHIEQFTGPALTADFNFTDFINIKPLPPRTVYEVVVRYAHSDVVLDEGQVAAAVKSTINWSDWTKEWLESPATEEAYRTSGAISLTIDTALQYPVNAKTLADFLLSILGGKKSGWAITIPARGLQVSIGQTCTLTVQIPAYGPNRRTRYGLDGTTKFVILNVSDTRQEGIIKLDVWGSQP